MNILFWNINQSCSFIDVIVEIVKEESIDLVAFAEFPQGQEIYFERELKKVDAAYAYYSPVIPTKVHLFYKQGVVDIDRVYDGRRINVNKVHSQINTNDYYLVFCHLRDQYSTDSTQLSGFARSVVDEILQHEEDVGCRRTIVCGDFNMDPFTGAMLEHDGFNAMQTEALANKISRDVEGKSYRLFYNPMWSLMGDIHGNVVPGTFYYAPSHPIQQYWHLLDQVILRPEVLSVFDKKQLKIITKGQNYNLLNKNNNINNSYSDHLPIKFILNI